MLAILPPCRAADHQTRDGSSFEKAIILARDDKHATETEMRIIQRLHPDVTTGSLELSIEAHNGRLYEIVVLKTTSGKKFSVYFDLSEKDPRPNQALERTATRRAFTFVMTKTVSPERSAVRLAVAQLVSR